VRGYDLIPNPVKKADRRTSGYTSQYGDQCWELDAIEPDELIRLCQTAVDALIQDEAAWLTIKERDRSDREALREQLESMMP
jgi:hypothetical protein